MLSNDNFFALLPVATGMWELRPDSVNLVAMPLFHIGGGGWAVAGMYQGAKTVHPPRPRSGGAAQADPRARHHPRLRRPGRAAVHADGAGRRRRRLLDAARSSSTAPRRSARTCWPAASRCSAASSGRPTGSPRRPERSSTWRPRTTTRRVRTATGCARAARPGPGVELRIVDPETREDVPTGDGRGDLGPLAAGDEGLLEQRRRPPARPSTTTAGSAPATPGTSTRTATCSSTTGSRT